MKTDVLTLDAEKAGTVDLPDDIFDLEPRKDILQRVVVWQLAKRRRGTHKTQSRGEVSGTRKKMYRQKGTGGARHGDKKVPQFRGGANAFGPKPRSHAIGLPKKVRVLGLKHALSAKARANELIILDKIEAKEPKTSSLAKSLEKLGLNSVLIVDGVQVNENIAKAAGNLHWLDVLPSQGINVYDILRRDKLVLTKAAIEQLEARFK